MTLTNSKIVEALAWMTAWIKTYPVTTVDGATSAYGSQTNEPLVTGQMPMVINANGILPVYARYAKGLDFSVIPVPTPAGPQANRLGWRLRLCRAQSGEASG